jgi:hypothetical protein
VEVELPAANPKASVEAITNRPLLLAAVGKATRSSRQATLYLTPLHGKANLTKALIANVHAAPQHVKTAAKQFKGTDRSVVMLRRMSDTIAPTLSPFKSPPWLPAAV